MRDEAFFATSMQDGRKFEGRMQDCKGPVGGRKRLSPWREAGNAYFFMKKMGCKKLTQSGNLIFHFLSAFSKSICISNP